MTPEAEAGGEGRTHPLIDLDTADQTRGFYCRIVRFGTKRAHDIYTYNLVHAVSIDTTCLTLSSAQLRTSNSSLALASPLRW